MHLLLIFFEKSSGRIISYLYKNGEFVMEEINRSSIRELSSTEVAMVSGGLSVSQGGLAIMAIGLGAGPVAIGAFAVGLGATMLVGGTMTESGYS
jgi:hypothetical protein